MPWGDRDINPGKGDVRDEAMHVYYKTLLHIRHHHPALSRGDYTLLSGAQDAVLAYVRHDAATNDDVLVMVNREDKDVTATFALPAVWSEKAVIEELENKQVTIGEGRIVLNMTPKSVRILSLVPAKVIH
jgi:glycosidase